MSDNNLIQSVARALDIMELLDAEGEMGITEISKTLGMEKSTVFRALATLKTRHYISQNPDNQRYANSYKLFEMGHNVVRGTGIPKMAYHYMRRLARSVKGAVNLAIRDGLKAVYIDKIESDETIKVCMKIGQGIPLYCTGLGKSLLAYIPEHELRSLLAKENMTPFTDKTICGVEELLEDLRQVRQRGYSIDDEEHLPGIVCVASPVLNAKSETIAAMSVATPKMVHTNADSIKEIGEAVFQAADGFTQSIGGRRPARF